MSAEFVNSDDRSDLGSVPVEPIHIAFFEGEAIREMRGKLPQIVLEMEEGYERGTHLRMMLELRVKSVAMQEDRKGDLVREHTFGLVQAQLVAAFKPEDARDGLGGSATTQAVPGESSELGVRFGRTSEKWPPTGTD